MAKISVLIPVYNVELYLSECLDSVVNQTEHDLEIICIDDASTDKSVNILQQYALYDDRIRVFKHSENKGLFQTRKDAVEVANGKYIMFLDSDDYLSLNACECLYQQMENSYVDFIQFGTEVLSGDNTSKDMVAWVENFMQTQDGIVDGNLVRACFLEHKFNCNLVNKIWKTENCKWAYEKMSDGYYISAEDRYSTFMLFYYAVSCALVSDKYYHYRLGVGVTGGERLDLSRFEKRCRGSLIVHKIYDFLKQENELYKYGEEFKAFKADILWDCVDCWYHKLPKEVKYKGYITLLNYWGAEAVTETIARFHFEDETAIFDRAYKNGKKAAIYYRYIGYDAMDMVIEQYQRAARKEFEQIVIITDCDAPERTKHYKNCELFHICSVSNSNWDQYSNRGKELHTLIEKQKINRIYYLSPTSHVSWLDQLLIEGLGVEFQMCMDEYVLDRLNTCQDEKRILEEKTKLFESSDRFDTALI